MRFITILVLAFTVILCSLISATIINVPDDYGTIQSGINASSDGDTVLEQPGTYYEIIIFNGHAIHLASLFLTTTDTSYISQTIIDGGGTFATIVLMSYENPAAITGFTITGGAGYAAGGGISLSSQSWCTIKHNIITGNSSTDQGGGIFVYSNTGDISHNVITGNSADHGGGILTSIYGWGLISDNIITNNTANSGGGMYFHNSMGYTIDNNYIANNTANGNGGGVTVNYQFAPTFTNNIITGNTATTGGGGMYANGIDSVKVYHNLIYDNSGTFYGGGLYIVDSKADLTNCTIADNVGGDGGGMLINNSSEVTMLNSIMWGNDASPGSGDEFNVNPSCSLWVTYSDVAGGWAGTGNIDADPMFVNTGDGDYHLLLGSPCIDTGDPDSPYDPDSTIADMGCFYYDQSVGINDLDEFVPFQYSLSQNYPNPFNASTLIGYYLPQPAKVRIEIYDILGRQITTLQDKSQPAGEHQIVWNANELSSGIYFYKIQAKDFIQTRKMLLLK